MAPSSIGGVRGSAERRGSVRHPIEVPIEITVGRELLIHATTNLSRDGAFLQRAIAFPVGTQVKVRILLPDGGAPIEGSAKVANVPDAHEVGMGLEFEQMGEAERLRIDAFTLLVRRDE